MSQSTTILRGLRCRCHKCGEGRVFDGYLRLKDHCEICGEDFTAADTADGPAFFVMFIALIIFGPFFFILPLTQWPLIALIPAFALVLGACLGFILWLLRPFKALLLNLQLSHKAEEAKFDSQ